MSRVAGREVENEDLVNVPNWLPVTIRLDGGQWLGLQTQEALGYRQELDLRRSVLTRLLWVRHLQGTHDPGRRILEAAGDSTNRYKASSRRMC